MTFSHIEWVPKPPAPTPPRVKGPVPKPPTTPTVLRGFATHYGCAIAVTIKEDRSGLPRANWTVTGRILECLPTLGHVRPTPLRETALAGTEAASRAEAAVMVERLLVAWERGVAA
ncbi:hypothetical protein [Tateyamaria pelophila]|uniref:hypothetical protein n=1 Tax=Tateyamaria pelophila TaxID=328415 RepID=UPI001CBFFACD|nr:hypothetical protein [Tateyamaria pelophila]